ncbi:MAG: GlxA family transcriptional regulator [Desulfovibrio sp.]
MKKQIHILLYDQSLGLDFLGPIEVFHAATLLAQLGKGHDPLFDTCINETVADTVGYDIKLFSHNQNNITTSTGIELHTQNDFTTTSPCHTLLIPGGFGTADAMNNSPFMDFLKAKSKQAQRIVSICTGSFLLAQAGILDGKKATTHWMHTTRFKEFFPQVNLTPDAVYTQDGNIWTSGGVTAGIDLALALVEKDFGLEIALEASRKLLVYFKRPGSQSQFSSPMWCRQQASETFAELHTWLLQNLSSAISVEDMAEFSAMSTRNFSRVFKNTTKVTPSKYLENIRLDRARELLSSGSDSIDSIALECGFKREERLRKAFLRKFAITPSQYRFHNN